MRESQLQSTIKYSLVICWSNCIDAVNVLLYSTREKTKNLIDLLATGQLVAFIHTHLSKLVTQLAMACISTLTSYLKDYSHSVCHPGTAECPVKSLPRLAVYVMRIGMWKYCYFCTYGFNAPFFEKNCTSCAGYPYTL